MNITFQKFDYKTQLEQQQNLFLECFPEVSHENNNVNNYLWQYQSFPGLPSSYEYIAKQGDEMIGYYAALPYRYKIGNKIVTVGMVCGVMTSSRHRKKGIFTKLGNYASEEQKHEGVTFNLTFPIRKAVLPGFLKMGWDLVFEMPLYIRFLKMTSFLKKKKIGFLAPFINPFVFAFNLFCHKSDKKDIEIRIFNNVEEIDGYEAFYSRWSISVPNTLIKDITFVKWRYGAPKSKYLFFCAYNAEHLVGFISARAIIKNGVPSYGILDFMVVDKNCLTNLHNALFNKAKTDNKEAVMMMMSKSSSKKYRIGRNAYLKSPFRFHLIIKNLKQEFSKAELYNEDLWHLMFVDSDDL